MGPLMKKIEWATSSRHFSGQARHTDEKRTVTMIQDIAPHHFDNTYAHKRAPQATDYVIVYDQRHVLLTAAQQLPRYRDVQHLWSTGANRLTYLFAIDQTGFFLLSGPVPVPRGWALAPDNVFRQLTPDYLAFAGTVAVHLGEWYAQNQFCGACGHRLEPVATDRALRCPNCHRTVFPRISPAIIVGVTQGDQLLLTRFLTGYQKHTLISGYTEIGETLEDTVRREVHEEVGLAVERLRYFGSQPWGLSGSLLAGFFADLDHAAAITLEHDELSEARWYRRDELPHDDGTRSLTWQMIEAFRQGKA